MTRLRYNKTLLDSICNRDKCKVKLTKQQYKDLIRDTQITFICGSKDCNKNGEKTLRRMYTNGGFCNTCRKTIANERRKDTNMIRYGHECSAQNAEVQQKIRHTNRIRYGHANPGQNVDVQQKVKDTNQIRYGYDTPFQNADVKQKIKETNLIRYGKENPLQNAKIMQKVKDTNLIRYGKENPMQNTEVQQKTKETNQLRYGHHNPLQNAEVSEKASKNAYKSKPYTFPCGNVIQVQGYEHFALELLVQQGYSFQNITTNRTQVPEIWYKTEDNKKHRYFCDILLHNEDKIVEVKSTWTYEKKHDNIQLKAKACINEGFEYEIWIFDDKKNLKVITYDKPLVTFSEMLLTM